MNPFDVRIITNNSSLSDVELVILVNAEVAKGVAAFNDSLKHDPRGTYVP